MTFLVLTSCAKKEPTIEDMILKYSHQYKVSPILVKAVVDVESRYNPYAIEKCEKGDKHCLKNPSIGLMQVKYTTAQSMNFNGSIFSLLDPDTNIKLGVQYIAKCLKWSKGNVNRALVMYNQGPGRAQGCQNWNDHDYVRKVNSFIEGKRI